MSKFEVVRGMYGGYCLALDDTRIAGPKPWGGGTVIHAWETNETYKAIDGHSRWHELFGTPERAAQTLEKAELETLDYCAMVDHRCDECRYEFDRYGCCDPTPLLEWLKGDA